MHDDQAARQSQASEVPSIYAPNEEFLATIVKDFEERHAREDRGPNLLPLSRFGGRSKSGERYVDLDEPLLGRPTRQTRDLLRRGESFGVTLDEACRALAADEDESLRHMAKLVRAKLLKPHDCYGPDRDEPAAWAPAHGHSRYCRWDLTPKGRTLALSSGRKPSTRKAAEALARKVVKAAEAVNANPDATLWWVKQIRAVGDFADPSNDTLVHVDLAVELRPRLADPAEQEKADRRLGDAARDRGPRGREAYLSWDGRWRMEQVLAGKSSVVRLFTYDRSVDGSVLFTEERNLTIETTPTAAYSRPGKPLPLDRCSWCGREGESKRVALRGQSLRASQAGLCSDCSVLGGFGEEDDLGARLVARNVRNELQQAPRQPHGCALCGHAGATRRIWWVQWRGLDETLSVELLLCDVCPGLLLLTEQRNPSAGWQHEYFGACLTGMCARLGLMGEAAQPRRRQQPRLLDVHRELLEDIRTAGALSAYDLARASVERTRNSRWWGTRIGHLLSHGLIVPLEGQELDYGIEGVTMRMANEEERALRRTRDALFVPGPRWTGERVTDPEPPAEWVAISEQVATLSAVLDPKALSTREETGLAYLKEKFGPE